MKKNLSSSDLANLNLQDAQEVVDEVWRRAEEQNPWKVERKDSISSRHHSSIQTVRVFVSSTFRDFFSEREILVKKIFPELREWGHQKGISIVDVDLRWGVPPNKTRAETIEICFDELKRCAEENEGYPFFLGLLGDRYGWIPETWEIPDELGEKFHWVKNASITHMEILHGAFWHPIPNQNAVFLFRDSVKKEGLAVDRLLDPDPYPQFQLEELKRRIKERYPNSCDTYSAVFNGYFEHDQIKLKNLDDFSNKVTVMLKTCIEYQLENRPKETMDPVFFVAETKNQWNYVVSLHSQPFVGRQEELEILKKFSKGLRTSELRSGSRRVVLRGYGTSKCSQDEDGKNNNKEDWRPILLLSGQIGTGKSHLLAKFVAEMKKNPEIELFYHFKEAVPDANSEGSFLRRILRFMKHPFAIPAGGENEVSRENLMKMASNDWAEGILKEFNYHMQRNPRKRYVIVIDGVDQIHEVMKWLPFESGTPRNVSAIIAVDSKSKSFRHYLRNSYCSELQVSALSKKNQVDLVTTYFDKFGKTLDNDQMDNLLRKERTPVWLSLALEELRVFGVLEVLNEKISALPDSIEELSWEVMSRVIREDASEKRHIEKVFKFLGCAQRGLPESGLLVLLGNFKKTRGIQRSSLHRAQSTRSPGRDLFDREEIYDSMDFNTSRTIPFLDLAEALRTIRPFIKTHSDGYVDFSCATFKTIVKAKLFPSEEDVIRYHEQLGLYYSRMYSKHMKFWKSFSCASALAYHISQTRNAKDLLRFFRKDPRANRIPPYMRLAFFESCTCGNPALNENTGLICSFCMPRFGLQCLLCKASLHLEGSFSCISISTNARHTACFNPKDVKVCSEHALDSMNMCMVCGNTDTTFSGKAMLCCECVGQKTNENSVASRCLYFSDES